MCLVSPPPSPVRQPCPFITVVAFSHTFLAKPSGIPGDGKRRDANLVRMRYFAARVEEVFQIHFSQYGDKQLHLVNLATHRDYRRRGCGTALCHGGMNKAADNGLISTVFGSPMGKRLYMSLGFEVIGTEPLRLPGEEEGMTMAALAHGSG